MKRLTTSIRERLHLLAASVVVKLMVLSFGIGIGADSIVNHNLVGWLVRLTASSGIRSFPVTFRCWNPLGTSRTFIFNLYKAQFCDWYISILVTKFTFTALIGQTSWSPSNCRIVLSKNQAA